MSLLAVATYNEKGLKFYDTSTMTACVDTEALPLTASTAQNYGVALSPDGATLAVAQSVTPGLSFLNTTTWVESIPQPTLGAVRSLAFYPDGTKLVFSRTSSPYVFILDLATNTYAAPTGGGTAGACYEVAVSPNGAFIAAAHSSAPRLTVYDAATQAKLASPSVLPDWTAYSCAFSPNSALLAVGHDGTGYLNVYNTTDWSSVTVSVLPTSTVEAVAFSTDGALLAVGLDVYPYLIVYETTTWTQLTLPNADTLGEDLATSGVFSLAWATDGSRLYIGQAYPGPPVRVVNTAGAASTWTNIQVATAAPYVQANGLALLPAATTKSISTDANSPVKGVSGDPLVTTAHVLSRGTGQKISTFQTAADGSYTLSPLLRSEEMQILFLDAPDEPILNDKLLRVIPS